MSDELLQAMWRAFLAECLSAPTASAEASVEASMRAVLDVLHANGYRRCAEGQKTTQWCDRAEKAEAEVERLREAANFAANAADGFRAELEQLRYDHETEVQRLTQERDAFMEMAERLTADLEALRARVFVRR